MSIWKPRASQFLILGAIALIVGELLHPPLPMETSALLGMIAASDWWGATHLLQALGAVLVAIGLVDRSVSAASGSNARLRTVAIAGVAIAVAALAIDGEAFKATADAWADAPRTQQDAIVLAFEPTLRMQRALITAATVLLFGCTPLLAGLSLTKRVGGRWAGRVGAGIGAAAVILGASTFVGAPLLSLPWHSLFSLAVGAWALWVGVLLWRDPEVTRLDRGQPAREERYVVEGASSRRLQASFDIKKL